MALSIHPPVGCDSEQTGYWGGDLLVTKTMSKSMMASIYLLLEVDGILPILFYDRVPEIDEFIAWLKRPTSAYLGAFYRPCPTLDEPDPKALLGGVGFVWDIGGGRGTVNMAFLKKYQGKGMPAAWTRQMIRYCFCELGLESLYGFTPAQNRSAVLFSRRLGFRQTGPLPRYGTCHGEPADCVISYMTKEMWEASIL